MASSNATLHPPRSAEETALTERFAKLPAEENRRTAFAAFAKTGLPHRRLEGWRWSDVRAALAGLKSQSGEALKDPFHALNGPSIYFYDDGLPPRGRNEEGLEIFDWQDAPVLDGADDLPLGALTAALASAPAMTGVNISLDAKKPLRLHFESRHAGQFRRLRVTVRRGVTAQVIETHLASGGFSGVLVDYQLEAGAKLDRIVYQAGAKQAVQTLTARIELHQGARLLQTSFALGAKLARIETRVEHFVGGSEAILNGAYLVGGGFHADLTSQVRHSHPACLTRQTVKGAARAGGRGVFQGKFFVARNAQKTDAEMQHNALLLEEGAEINAKPELEIYADDVQCAHGNTAGALDAAALFYMRQRGIPEAEARALLTESFIAEAFGGAEAKIAEILLEDARRWLGGAP